MYPHLCGGMLFVKDNTNMNWFQYLECHIFLRAIQLEFVLFLGDVKRSKFGCGQIIECNLQEIINLPDARSLVLMKDLFSFILYFSLIIYNV